MDVVHMDGVLLGVVSLDDVQQDDAQQPVDVQLFWQGVVDTGWIYLQNTMNKRSMVCTDRSITWTTAMVHEVKSTICILFTGCFISGVTRMLCGDYRH